MSESIAEREGMSFTDRCAAALNHLRQAKDMIALHAESEMLETEREASMHEASLEQFTPQTREFLRSFAAEIARIPVETGAKARDILWSNALESARELFGEDAFAFALTTIHRERPGN